MDEELKVPRWRLGLAKLIGKLEGKLGSFRRRYLKIDPETDFFILALVRQSDRLLKRIYPDDTFFLQARYAHVSPEDARKLFLYGYTRHILKAGVFIMEQQDFLLEKIKNKDVDTLGRAVIETIVDSQNALARKLIEMLVNLINFSSTNNGELFRIFRNTENLERFLGRQKDSKYFFGFESNNTQHSIKTFSERIRSDLGTITESPWFLKNKWDQLDQPPVFTSILARYKRALTIATDEEKIAMGASYFSFFSDLSGSVHPEVGARDEKHYSHDSIRGNITFISMLALHCISRINALLDIDDPEDLRKVLKDGKSWGPSLVKQNLKREFQIGDIVLAGNDLAEIVETKTSIYAYTSYKVRLISRPPLPEFPEDWLKGSMVIGVMPKNQVRPYLLKYKDDPNAPAALREANELMAKETDEVLHDLAKRSLLEMFNRGVLIKMLLLSGQIKMREQEE